MDNIDKLKENIETINKLKDIQKKSLADDYMVGMFNGLELALTVLETRNPEYKELNKTNLSFGQAIELMKKGYKVAREGWNGKGMFIYIQNSSFITQEMGRNEVLKNIDGDIKINAHIDMKTVDGSITIGWLASQSDMLSNDWVIVE